MGGLYYRPQLAFTCLSFDNNICSPDAATASCCWHYAGGTRQDTSFVLLTSTSDQLARRAQLVLGEVACMTSTRALHADRAVSRNSCSSWCVWMLQRSFGVLHVQHNTSNIANALGRAMHWLHYPTTPHRG